ncbi:MAG: acyltransferase [Acidobacteria bacterium]|nr:MAG: acyltransferase [Acidobacteriota bacterium]
MPRYEYRTLHPDAEKSFLAWIDHLDKEFSNPDPAHRSVVVRDALHQIYLGRPYVPEDENEEYDNASVTSQLSARALTHSFDPRNATLEPEYYGDVDPLRYAPRKPLIWFWMMFDRSPLGLNHWLGYRMRYMVAKHVFKSLGKNVKLFHGIEVSFGYNLTIEDNCVIHKYVLLDDRGELIVREGSSISDYANVYSHAHDLNDSMIVSNHKTVIGPRARVTYHATVLSGVTVGEQGIVGSMGVATKDVEPYNVVAGIPAKTVKVKTIAPEARGDRVQRSGQR